MEAPWPRYAVEIDEEGFPLFDGLRVQDEGLLESILKSLKRRTPGDPSSVLVTACEGEVCWINAFDAPLVAQTVENVDDTQARWIFPGGRSEVVTHASIEIDPWNRMHAAVAGADSIPAVLSRKAQAEFLHRAPASRIGRNPFRKPAPDRPVGVAQFWDSVYQEGRDGFEMGAPSPVLEAEISSLKSALPSKARILVPGAGRGHDAVFLQTSGWSVEALDFSETAATEFRRRYPQSSLPYHTNDAFEFLSRKPGSWDAIFEHTLYCAVDPLLRADYVKRVHEALAPEGLFFGVFFLRTSPGGPPFGMTQWELRETTKDLFEPRAWKVSMASVPARKGQELWAILRKK